MKNFLCLALLTCMGPLAFSQKNYCDSSGNHRHCRHRPGGAKPSRGSRILREDAGLDGISIHRSPGWFTFLWGAKAVGGSASSKDADEHPFRYVAFATTDAKRMRLYLVQQGVTVPASITRWTDGSQGFRVKDPEGNTIEFIQRGPLPAHSTPDSRAISSQMIHAGFQVHDVAAEDDFYKKTLGFRPYWKGGDERRRHGFCLDPGAGRHGLDRVHAERSCKSEPPRAGRRGSFFVGSGGHRYGGFQTFATWMEALPGLA